MTIIIESGQAGADSVAYCSVAQADAYFLTRGVTIWAPLSSTEKESALVRGCDYLMQSYRARWAGQRASSAQALDWPRYNAPRDYGDYYPSDAIPVELRNANAEAALRAAAGELIEDLEPQVASEKVGPIETTYFQGGSRIKRFPVIDKMLQPLIGGQGGLKLVRA